MVPGCKRYRSAWRLCKEGVWFLSSPGGGGCARGSGFCFVSEVRCTLFFLGKNARSIDTQKRVNQSFRLRVCAEVYLDYWGGWRGGGSFSNAGLSFKK